MTPDILRTLAATIAIAGHAVCASGQVTVRFVPDRSEVFHHDVITWTARFEFPGYSDPMAALVGFEGAITVNSPGLGPVTAMTSLVGGPIEQGESLGLKQHGVAAAQQDPATELGSPVDLFTFQTRANWGGPASISMAGTVRIAPDDSSPVISFDSFQVVSEPVNIDSPYAGPDFTYEQTPEFPGQYDQYGQKLDAEGRYTVVGSPAATVGPIRSGAAYIVDLDTREQVARLLPSNATEGGEFGAAVVIDGGLVAISAPQEDLGVAMIQGAIYIYDLDSGDEIRRIEPPHVGVGPINPMGYSLAFSDGIIVASTALELLAFDADTGAHLYTIDWLAGRRTGALHAENGKLFADYGRARGFSPNGPTLGKVYDLANGDELTTYFLGNELDSDAADFVNASFGGGFAVFGLPLDTEIPGDEVDFVNPPPGVVYVYDWDSGELLRRIVGLEAGIVRRFGQQLATDGERLVAGGIASTVNEPTVYSDGVIFDLGTGWIEGSIPLHQESQQLDLAFVEDEIIVGDFLTDANGPDSGRLAVYDVAGPCSRVDLVAPWGVLDLVDLTSFVTAFVDQHVAADIADPRGVFDLNDIQTVVAGFMSGCP